MAYNRPARRDEFRGRSEGGRFNRGRTSGFGQGRRSRDKSFGRPEMHQAVCAKCGKQCEVPFKPTGDKPVYCSDCFRQNEGSNRNFSPRGQDRNRSVPAQQGISSEQHTEINAKLDKILKILQNLDSEFEDDSDEEFEDEFDEEPEEAPKKKQKSKSKSKPKKK